MSEGETDHSKTGEF